MAKIRLKYLVQDSDRHGNVRWYVRVPGRKKVRLRAEPGTTAFNSAYGSALSGQSVAVNTRTAAVLRPIEEDSIQQLVNAYYSSFEWTALSPATQKQRRSILNRICLEHGDRDAKTLSTKVVREGRNARRDTPGAANNMLKTLKALYVWGIEHEFVDHNPVIGIKRLPMNPAGFHTWTPEECLTFEKAHPMGTNARTAYALALYGGLRRSDVVSVGRQHVTKDGYLKFSQFKTNKQISILIAPPLRMTLDAIDPEQLHFVLTEYGKPFSRPGIGNAMKKWTQTAGLPSRCSLHGLRKALGARLAEAGLTENQIAAVLGHSGTGAVKTYTRGANQKKLAAEALIALEEYQN